MCGFWKLYFSKGFKLMSLSVSQSALWMGLHQHQRHCQQYDALQRRSLKSGISYSGFFNFFPIMNAIYKTFFSLLSHIIYIAFKLNWHNYLSLVCLVNLKISAVVSQSLFAIHSAGVLRNRSAPLLPLSCAAMFRFSIAYVELRFVAARTYE